MLDFEDLKNAANSREIDTVLVSFVDMQGRLMGKRCHVADFIDHAHLETHCCNYLLATDIEMTNPQGYAATNWQQGYGDYMMKPDLATLRPVPWLEGTAMVLCDILYDGGLPVSHSPREVLKRQISRAEAMGFEPMMATELEFFLFRGGYDDIRLSGHRDLKTLSLYNGDYNLLQSTKEEHVMRPLRNCLFEAGIPVENTKGEAEIGQVELNIRYADALRAADHHAIAKHATKEIAWAEGVSASFLAKWSMDHVGSAAHIHQSLWHNGKPAFHDPAREHAKSDVLDAYLAGLIKYAPDCTVFLAPYINSYKRFQVGTFAPTRTVWSIDNRTAGFRLVGAGTKGVRPECRIGGSDLNPYLAMAAQLAAGLSGIEEGLSLPAPSTGDIYYDKTAPQIPTTLHEATEIFRRSQMLRQAMGDGVVDHYTRAAEIEQEYFDVTVTDWEIARGFERA